MAQDAPPPAGDLRPYPPRTASPRRQTRTIARIERVIAEATRHFASDSYSSVSTRRIAESAGIAHQLVLYHFKTKDNLWREVILAVARRYRAWFDERLAELEGHTPAQMLRAVQGEFVRFSAHNAELSSIMMHGTGHSADRLEWLVAKLIAPTLDIIVPLVRAAQATGHYVSGDPVHLQYAFMGAATRVIMLAPEVELMTGRSPLTAGFLNQHVDLCLALFFRDPPFATAQ